MKSTELRIGNYIQTFDNNIVVVSKLKGAKKQDRINDEPYNGYYKPIPLTEEWLLNFGFEKMLDKTYGIVDVFEIHGLTLSFLCDSYLYGTTIIQNDFSYIMRSPIKIKYVHQLQNLYFALTGEELKLKDDETKS